MKDSVVFVLIPIVGYVGLWILGSVLFLVYFRIFRVQKDSDYTAMIRKIPPVLAITTVPACSIASFLTTTRTILGIFPASLTSEQLLVIGLISLFFTIGLDMLITVGLERINILAFPIDLMYVLAWVVIVPSVLLAGY